MTRSRISAAALLIALSIGTGITYSAATTASATVHPSPTSERCDGDGGRAVFERTQIRAKWTTAVFGWLSILASLAVLAVTYAYGKDRRSLRDRIVVGLFLANIAFSIGMSIPVHARWCDQDDGKWKHISSTEGWLVTSYISAFGFIYAGKYWTIGYELFIVVVSVLSLRSGSTNIPRWAEIASHAACFLAFAIVFGVYVATNQPGFVSEYHHGFHNPRTVELMEEGNAAERRILDGWIAFFIAFVLACLYQRLYLHRLIQQWGVARTDAEQDWNRDLWNTSNPAVQEERDRKQLLLEMRKQSYLELAKPLEPYVVVFVAFAIPAVILATVWCSEEASRVILRRSGPALDCHSVCYLILSLRPLATAAVYFGDKQCRVELCDVGTLRRKLWRRFCGFCAWVMRREAKGRGLRFGRGAGLEQVRIIDDDDDVDPNSVADGGSAGSAVRYELMEG